MKKSDFYFFCVILIIFVPFFLSPSLYEAYKSFNAEHGMVMSFFKFAVLSTLGELLGLRISSGAYFRAGFGILPRAFVWGVLGMGINMAFIVFSTGVTAFAGYLGVHDPDAIMAGALHAAEVMQEESERISGQMLGSFEGVADAYGARRDAFLDRAAACGLDTGIWKEQYGLRMKTQLAGVPPLEFGWAGPLWPNVKCLLDCNVIETIRSGIGQALSEWERSAAGYIRALRAALFTAARQEVESMPSLLRSAADSESKIRSMLTQLETDHQEHAKELSELAAQGAALLAGLYEQEEG